MVEWRPAVGAPHYQASDQGDIRSLDRIDLQGRFHRGRILHPTPNAKSGYLMVTICEDGVRVKRYVHDIVCECFHGSRPPTLEVRHLNGIRSDCRATNLEWGSRTENIYDAVAHGTHHFASRDRCINDHPYSPSQHKIFPVASASADLHDVSRRTPTHQPSAPEDGRMSICKICNANANAYLCGLHTTYLGDMLDQAVWLVKEGEVTETRQDKLDQAPRTGTVHSSVVNFGMMRALSELWMLLRDTVTDLVDDNGLKFLPACSVGCNFIGPIPVGWRRLPKGYSADSVQLLRWLRHHLVTLVSREDVGEFYRALVLYVGDPDRPCQPGKLLAMVNKRSRVFAGLCPTVTGYDHRDGGEIYCDTTLWALDGDAEVICPRCGYSADVSQESHTVRRRARFDDRESRRRDDDHHR